MILLIRRILPLGFKLDTKEMENFPGASLVFLSPPTCDSPGVVYYLPQTDHLDAAAKIRMIL